VEFTKSEFNGSSFERATMDHSKFDESEFIGAILYESNLRHAKFTGAKLVGADLCKAKLAYTNLEKTHLESATLKEAEIYGASFTDAFVGKIKGGNDDYDLHMKLKDHKSDSDSHTTLSELLERQKATNLNHCKYLPVLSDFFPIQRFLTIELYKDPKWKKFVEERWFFTSFDGVRIDDADTAFNLNLNRYIKDQQFLLELKTRHPSAYLWWRRLMGCGENIWYLAGWSLAVIIVFAVLYYASGSIEASTHRSEESLLLFLRWFFISFDIFTNLGVRDTYPFNSTGVFLIFLENAFGLLALGATIAVATNKWVRRS
jgi:hypothetical protein